MPIATTPSPPYFVVVFTSQRAASDAAGYDQAAARMMELAVQQPGFLGVETARGEDGLGLTVSYWESREAIANWKANGEHQTAQAKGRETWYTDYRLRIAKVEREAGA